MSDTDNEHSEVIDASGKSADEKIVKIEKEHDDSIKWRSKYKVAREELETHKARTESEKNELASKIEATSKGREMFEKKYIDAEVKAHAVAAGIRDIEFVKLINTSDVKLDEKGDLQGVEKAIADLKARKPDWFGTEKKFSSSTNASFPEKETKTAPDARTMSKEDWAKNKSRFMAGRF